MHNLFKNKIITACIAACLPLCLFLQTRTADASLPQTNAEIEFTQSDGFLWPIPGCNQITSLYGLRNIKEYGYERKHAGIDINAATGTPVIAAESGFVVVSCTDGGYGEYIIINHGNNLITVYGHLKSREVSRGDSVQKGDLIGYSGNTGISSAPHLHFEVRINGTAVTPFQFSYS